MRRHHLVLVLALLAAPGAAVLAQVSDAPAEARRQQRPGPTGMIGALLAQRAELGLSAAQVARLEQIQAELEQKNGPLTAEMQALRPDRGDAPSAADREAMRTRRAGMQPLMTRIRENTEAAMELARAVLTEEQADQARGLVRGPGMRAGMEGARQHQEGPGGPGGARGPGGPGAPGR